MANAPATRKKPSTSSTTFVHDPATSEEVLRRLQDKAKPEPIKVACLHTPPDKPEYLDEGYHGKISKEEVLKLLSGKTGRYLVRESTSKPGDIVLSMNFDGEVKHYRLLYDGRTFKTEASESGFVSVTELLIHVLELCRQCKAIEDNRKRSKMIPHQFESHTFLHPKWCEVCGGFLWGLRYQGVKCDICGMSVHKHCKAMVTESCNKGSPSKTDRSHSLTPLLKGKPGRVSPPQISPKTTSRKLSSKFSCYYYNKSLRFLTHNFSVRLFDLENNLNKCYCEDCLLGPRGGGGRSRNSSALGLSTMLQNWCRFPICPPQSIKRNLKELEVVYVACKAEEVKAILNGWVAGHDQFAQSTQAVPSMAYLNELFKQDNLSTPFRDALDDEIKQVQTVLEVFVEPASVEVRTLSRDVYFVDDEYEGRNGISDSSENHSSALQPEIWEITGESKIFPAALLIRILRERSFSSPS